MTTAELDAHWQNLAECEATGARPRVYRQLLEEIRDLKAQIAANEDTYQLFALLVQHATRDLGQASAAYATQQDTP